MYCPLCKNIFGHTRIVGKGRLWVIKGVNGGCFVFIKNDITHNLPLPTIQVRQYFWAMIVAQFAERSVAVRIQSSANFKWTFIYFQLYWKDENKKDAWNGTFEKSIFNFGQPWPNWSNLQSVWPDDRIKSSPIFPKTCPKSSPSSFYMKRDPLQNSSESLQIFL